MAVAIMVILEAGVLLMAGAKMVILEVGVLLTVTTMTSTILEEMADKVDHSMMEATMAIPEEDHLMTEATMAIPEEEVRLVEVIKIHIILEEMGDKEVHLMMEVAMVTPEEEGPLVEMIKTHITLEETVGKADHTMVEIIMETLEGEEGRIVIGTNILVMIVPILTLEIMLDRRCLLSFSVLYSVTY
jgi:hypothetical protein